MSIEIVPKNKPPGFSLSKNQYSQLSSVAGQVKDALFNYSMSDLEDFNEGAAAGGVASSAAQGALAGATIAPPWGAIAGGAIGLVTGLFGFDQASGAHKEAQRKTRESNRRSARDLYGSIGSAHKQFSKKLSTQKSQVHQTFKSGAYSAKSTELLKDAGARWSYVQSQPGGASNELIMEALSSNKVRMENIVEGAMVANLQKIDVLDQIEDESRRRSGKKAEIKSKSSDVLGKKTLAGAKGYAEQQSKYFDAVDEVLWDI